MKIEMETKNLYLIVDGALNGTGLRDENGEGYLDPKSLGLSHDLAEKLSNWLQEYEAHHYENYSDEQVTSRLDDEGIAIAREIKAEFENCKISYYSDAKSAKFLIA